MTSLTWPVPEAPETSEVHLTSFHSNTFLKPLKKTDQNILLLLFYYCWHFLKYDYFKNKNQTNQKESNNTGILKRANAT